MKVSAATTPANEPALNANDSRYIAKAPMKLQIPRAQDWTEGMKIKDDQGGVLFHVAEHVMAGDDVMPHYGMFLTGADGGSVLAFIEAYAGAAKKSWCKIYLAEPGYMAQPVTVSCWKNVAGFPFTNSKENQAISSLLDGQDMYLRGKLFANNKYVGPKTKEVTLKYETVSGGKKWFKGSTRRVVEFKDPTTCIVKLTRDQIGETLSIESGANILEAVSLAYAVDRRHKILGSKAEEQARPRMSYEPGATEGRKVYFYMQGAC